MGKISPVSSKYIIHATIEIDGVVDRPDVIGAIFGQTEGLLGADLELRELQRSGRIGRIEVNVDTHGGKTAGKIIIPSSLDKAETSIVGAALEVIQRIGPCNAKIKVENIEDVRVSKRQFVIERAKELLKMMMDGVLPDSQEIADEVAHSVRVMEIQEYGRDKLPAGPAVEESDEVIVVEGRADVLNLLKHGIKNAVAINGTSVPPTIVELSKQKVVTVFVDGDRGGQLIIKELTAVADIDYVTQAPDGKEVEEITKKEIHKAIRSRISVEQVKMELGKEKEGAYRRVPAVNNSITHQSQKQAFTNPKQKPQRTTPTALGQNPAAPPSYLPEKVNVSPEQKLKFREMLEDLIGTRGAYILNDKLNILGKVPLSELVTTLKSLNSGVYAVVFDGAIDANIVGVAVRSNVKFLVAMETQVKPADSKVPILTVNDL